MVRGRERGRLSSLKDNETDLIQLPVLCGRHQFQQFRQAQPLRRPALAAPMFPHNIFVDVGIGKHMVIYAAS